MDKDVPIIEVVSADQFEDEIRRLGGRSGSSTVDKENLAIIRRRAEHWSREPWAVRGEEMPGWLGRADDVNDLLSLAHAVLKLLDEIEQHDG